MDLQCQDFLKTPFFSFFRNFLDSSTFGGDHGQMSCQGSRCCHHDQFDASGNSGANFNLWKCFVASILQDRNRDPKQDKIGLQVWYPTVLHSNVLKSRQRNSMLEIVITTWITRQKVSLCPSRETAVKWRVTPKILQFEALDHCNVLSLVWQRETFWWVTCIVKSICSIEKNSADQIMSL